MSGDAAERDRTSLQQMIEAGELIQQFARGGKRRFLADKMVQSAIERQFEILGEAARRLSPQIRDAHPQVPWRSIVGFRNFLSHGYDSVVPDRVWETIGGTLKGTLPALREIHASLA